MKKELILTISLVACTSAFASVCDPNKRPAGYIDEKVGSSKYTTHNGYGKYDSSNNTSQLFIHPDDCDTDEDNDVAYRLEAIPCQGTDKSYNQILSQAMRWDGIMSRDASDSTSLRDFVDIQKELISEVQSNTNNRHCDSPVEYDGGYNKTQYCEIPSGGLRIQIERDAIVQGIPNAAETYCYVDLKQNLKVDQEVVLNNVNYVTGSGTDFYTMGYATVRCGMHSTTKQPTLFIGKNPDDGSCNLTDIDFYNNPQAASTCRQVCFWAEDMYCAAKRVEWIGLTGRKCSAEIGQGFLDDQITVESQSLNNSGKSDFICGLGGTWYNVLGTSFCN